MYLVGGTKDKTVPLLAENAVFDVYRLYGTEKIEYLKKDIGHDAYGSDPIAGVKYIYS